MNRLTFLISLLCVFLIIGCAPRHLKYRIPPVNRKEVLRESNTHMKGIERKSWDIKIRQFLYRIRFYLGTTYKYRGNSRQGMDCSGFVSTVFRESFNIELPHNAFQIYQNCQKISNDELTLGDLVFFRTANSKRINHVGIYLVENCFAHASLSYGVIISELTENYYRSRYAGAGRIVEIKIAPFDDRQ
ncbi:MAG: C40 family peptidase [bacterium]|nr:MAG: C40 family peptidase [bacterium]